jgi:hypothetical protein
MWYKFQGGGSELLKVEGPLKTVVQLGSCKCWYALRTPCPDWDTCYLDILPITLVYDDRPSRSVSWKDNTGLTTTVGSCECWYTKRYPCGDCDIALKPGNEVIERGALDVYPRRKVSVSWQRDDGVKFSAGPCECWYALSFPCGECSSLLETEFKDCDASAVCTAEEPGTEYRMLLFSSEKQSVVGADDRYGRMAVRVVGSRHGEVRMYMPYLVSGETIDYVSYLTKSNFKSTDFRI